MSVLNPALTKQLASATSKTHWSTLFRSLVGVNTRIRCYWSTNPSSANPVTDGIKFLDMGTDGNFEIISGNIKGFGVISNVTTHLPVNLLIGSGRLVIENDLYSCTLTLGPIGGNTEYFLSTNPTGATNEGFALLAGSGIKAPEFLPSGTGYPAPSLSDDSVVAFRLIDYTDEANPVVGGTSFISHRDPDMVMDIPFMAAEYGDVRIQRTPDGEGIVFGTGGECFKFAATVYHMSAQNNSEANVPVQQVEIRAKVHDRWPSYPFKADLNTGYDVIIPKPFKIELLRRNGSVAGVIEMYSTRDANNTPGSGKPMNFKGQQSASRDFPIQPWWTSQMVLAWWSHRPKTMKHAQHLIPPVDSGAMGQRNVKDFVSSQDCWPSYTNHYTFNGLNTWRVAPAWSRTSAQKLDTTIVDPNMNISEISRDGYMTQAFGYKYEPASNCLHVWFNPPGGTRHDRAPFPTALVTWLTDPNGIRPHGAVPYKEMMHHWNMGYFNHSQYMFTNVERGEGIPKSKVRFGEICYNDTYYRGSSENFRPNIEFNAVRLLAALNSKDSGVLDKYGRRFTNEYSRDNQHSQSSAADGAYTYISPMHVFAAKHSFVSSILAQFDLTQQFNANQFLMRQHAWFMLMFVKTWIVSNSDARNFSKNEIEEMMVKHLERVYDAVYLRFRDGTDIYARTLRNLGMHGTHTNYGTHNNIELDTDSKSCYMGGAMMLMKQCGLFDEIRVKSNKCQLALDMILQCMAKFSINAFVDGNGLVDRFGGSVNYAIDAEPPINNWTEYTPPRGIANWVTPENGDRKSETIDAKNTMHFRAQTASILRDFFPEYNFPFADVAVEKVKGWYKLMDDEYAAGNAWYFKYRFSMMGMHQKPARIGAPV